MDQAHENIQADAENRNPVHIVLDEAQQRADELAHQALMDKARNGDFSSDELQTLGFMAGQDGIKIKTKPFVMTEHQFEIVRDHVVGTCTYCHRSYEELRLLAVDADPGPYKCLAARAVKQQQQADRKASYGGRGGGASGAGRGGAFGASKGRGFGQYKKQ